MIKKGKKYKVFNVEKAQDKNGKVYHKFSIGDSTMDPQTRNWSTEWWNCMSYSTLDGIKNHDFVTVKDIGSVSATQKGDKVYRSLFISAEPSAKEPVADFTQGEDKSGALKGQQKIDDLDDILPF